MAIDDFECGGTTEIVFGGYQVIFLLTSVDFGACPEYNQKLLEARKMIVVLQRMI